MRASWLLAFSQEKVSDVLPHRICLRLMISCKRTEKIIYYRRCRSFSRVCFEARAVNIFHLSNYSFAAECLEGLGGHIKVWIARNNFKKIRLSLCPHPFLIATAPSTCLADARSRNLTRLIYYFPFLALRSPVPYNCRPFSTTLYHLLSWRLFSAVRQKKASLPWSHLDIHLKTISCFVVFK